MRRKALIALGLGTLLSGGLLAFDTATNQHPLTPLAVAKKKKSKKADKAFQEALEPLETDLQALRIAVLSRRLLSHEDLKTLTTLQLKFSELAQEYPAQEGLARPLFHLAQLLEHREHWLEAYEFYNLLSVQYAEQTQAALASRAVVRLRKQHSELLPEPPKPATEDDLSTGSEVGTKKEEKAKSTDTN